MTWSYQSVDAEIEPGRAPTGHQNQVVRTRGIDEQAEVATGQRGGNAGVLGEMGMSSQLGGSEAVASLSRVRPEGQGVAFPGSLEPPQTGRRRTACKKYGRHLELPDGSIGFELRRGVQGAEKSYYLGDEVGLTQTLGWVGAWTSQPSAYAVAARTTADVVAAVNFARQNNLRLVVKGGGHSYQGTSNAADSLLIWTRANAGD